MDVQEMLARVRAGDVPGSWDVWKLRNDRVGQDLALFAFGAVLGLVLFGVAVAAMIPGNFEQGIGSALVSLVVLVVLAGLGFGSLTLVIQDVSRLRRADQYLLIMAPDDFVKVEPGRITQVPMECISNVTLKGVKAEKSETEQARAEAQRNAQTPNVMDRLLGSVARNPKVSPSLAFIDTRTDSEVVVSNDTTFGDLRALQETLNFHVRAKAQSNPA